MIDEQLQGGGEQATPAPEPESSDALGDALSSAIEAHDETTASDTPIVEPEETVEPEAAPAVELPDSWPAEFRDQYLADDPTLMRAAWRDHVQKTLQSADKRVGQFEQDALFAREIQPHLAHIQEDIAAEGLTPSQAVERLVGLSMFAKRDPVEYARYYVQAAGLHPEQVFPGYQPTGAGEDVEGGVGSPQYQQLANTVTALQNQLQGVQQGVQQQQQHAQQQERGAIDKAISAFQDAKDEAGLPARPYFQADSPHRKQVEAAMMHLVTNEYQDGDYSTRLQQAYDEAIWRVPAIRQELMQQSAPKVEKPPPADVEKAKVAKGAPAPRDRGKDGRFVKAQTLDDAIDAAMEGF